jgi:nucleotide-binding universal stress UspA family protein
VFKHILFPTDGTPASRHAAEVCIRFAARVGARVTALLVVPPPPLITWEAAVPGEIDQIYRNQLDARTKESLAPVEALAQQAGVGCKAMVVQNREPYEAIIDTAHDEMCDLIAMASHGRRGMKALLLGSQTQRVLTHSAIPVLVLREPALPAVQPTDAAVANSRVRVNASPRRRGPPGGPA